MANSAGPANETAEGATSQAGLSSLRMRVTALICLLVACLNGLILLVWVPRVQDVLKRTTIEYSRSQIQTLGGALVPYLLSNQLSGVYQTLDGVLKDKQGWHSFRVTDATGRQIFPLAAARPKPSPGIATFSVDITFGHRKIATLTAEIDLSDEFVRIRHEGRVFALTITAVMSALLIGFILLLDQWVTKPVRVMSTAAQALQRGNYEAHLPVSSLADIRRLTTAFEAMRRDILAKERNLIEARGAAEDAASVKSRILAVMSHEMRTPLNGILGLMDLLLATRLNPEQKKYAATIHDLGGALLRQIEDVLSVARYEAKGGEATLRPVDINALVAKMMDGMRVLADKNNTRLVFHPCQPDETVILSDESLLRHIVQNLLSNAIKFTRQGQITITVAVEPAAQALSIVVADTGIGIAADIIDKIFDDFVSVSPDPEQLNQGTGLGLGIVRRMVASLRGTITVESTPGQGARFMVNLPWTPAILESPVGRDPRNADQPVIAQLTNLVSGKGEQAPTILVVEDNRVNTIILVKMLERFGFIVDQAENGQTGLERSETKRYFAILTDLQMPRLNGDEMLRAIRTSETNPNRNTPVIVVSAQIAPDGDTGITGPAFDDIVLKPFDKTQVAACLARLYETQPPEDTRAAEPAISNI